MAATAAALTSGSGVASTAPVPLAPPLGRWWVATIAVASMVASDFKFRIREVDSALAGRPDLNVILEVVVYALVATYVVMAVGIFRSRPPVDRLLVAALLFAGVTALSAAYSVYPALGLVRGVQTVIVAGFAVAVAGNARREHLVRFVQLYVVATAAATAVGVVFPQPRLPLQLDRFNWLHVHPVRVGTYLGLAVVALVALLADRRLRDLGVRAPAWVWWSLLGVNAGALVATKTRGAVAGALVGALVVLLVRGGRRRLLDTLVVGAVAIAFVVVAFGPHLVDFAERGQPAEAIATLNSRTLLWELAVDAFAERPVEGYGLGASRGLFYDETGLGGGHNAFVEILVASGAVGAVLFVVLLAGVGLRACRLRGRAGRADRPLLLGFLAFSLVNAMTTDGLAAPANVSSVWLFTVVGWLVVSTRADAVERAS